MTESITAPRESTRRLVARLGTNSAIYAIGNAVARAAPILLVPLFTRVLSPADYGVLAIATAVGSLLSLVLLMSLDSAITTMHFRLTTEAERARLNASLLVMWIVGGGLVAIALEVAGRWGMLDLVRGVPFDPYLRLVLWTSFASVFIAGLQTLYATAQRPLHSVALGMGQMLLTITLSVYFVAVKRRGADGVLLANLLAAAITGSLALVGFARFSRGRPSRTLARQALVFALPLIPHVTAAWVLNLSDRTILQRFVPDSDIGIYALGYQIGSIMMLLTHGISYAFFPVFNSEIRSDNGARRIPMLGTYAMLATITAGLATALLGGDVIHLVTPPAFHHASRVVPWIAAAATFQGMYYVWSRPTWFSMKTGWVPLITSLAAALSIGLNFLAIPRFGYIAAAVSNAVAFAFLALAHAYLAHRIMPISWEYRRWIKLLGAACVSLAAGLALRGLDPVVGVVVHSLLLVILFPGILLLVGFFTTDELRLLRQLDLGAILTRTAR